MNGGRKKGKVKKKGREPIFVLCVNFDGIPIDIPIVPGFELSV